MVSWTRPITSNEKCNSLARFLALKVIELHALRAHFVTRKTVTDPKRLESTCVFFLIVYEKGWWKIFHVRQFVWVDDSQFQLYAGQQLISLDFFQPFFCPVNKCTESARCHSLFFNYKKVCRSSHATPHSVKWVQKQRYTKMRETKRSPGKERERN